MDTSALVATIVLTLAMVGLGFAGFNIYRASSQKLGLIMIIIGGGCGMMAMNIFFKLS